jgi:hypothetical protein
LTSLLEKTWRVPPGYQAVRTNERIWTESAEYLSGSRAEHRAGTLNDRRQDGALYECAAVRHGRWRVVAYRLRLAVEQ